MKKPFQSLNLSEEDEFDIVRTVILTTRQTKLVKDNPGLYRVVSKSNDCPFLNDENPYYVMTLRFVRIKVAEGKYICIITNLLDQKEVTTADLKYIYHLRWGHLCERSHKTTKDPIER